MHAQVRLDGSDASWSKYLIEGMDVELLQYKGKVIDVGLANTVTLTVADTDPGVKGNTAQGGSKPATLESGAVVQVPLFVAIGDRIDIDTRTNEYRGRNTA